MQGLEKGLIHELTSKSLDVTVAIDGYIPQKVNSMDQNNNPLDTASQTFESQQ